MTHTYTVNGMTCDGCRDKVEKVLAQVPGIKQATVNLETNEATLQMEYHVPADVLRKALAAKGDYSIEEKIEEHHAASHESMSIDTDEPVTLRTYWPLILVFLYIVGGVVVSQVINSWQWMDAMGMFMGLFFVVFSFFKFLDLEGFALSYSSYDIVAQKWLGYGYLYPLIELALGIAYLTHFEPVITNGITLIVMSISTIGVLNSILRKSKFKCACLGTVFNLPMSTVTLVEDSLMVIMAALMLILLL